MSNCVKKIAKNFYYDINPYLPFLRSYYLKIINNRSTLPFTAIKELSNPISFLLAFTYETHTPNDFYGHATILKKFLGLPDSYKFKFNIEHGTSLTENVANLDIDSLFNSIIVPGKRRADFLKKFKQFTFSIGPYIYYSPYLLTKSQMKAETDRLGKNLLVFPSHSTSDLEVSYSIKNFCKTIKEIGEKYNSVRVCLYWKDIQNGNYKQYQEEGFECVTAGHVLDYNFLPRLKSIIKTSTMTISNGPGTFIGYCIFLGKPHTIIKQKLVSTGLKGELELMKKELDDKRTIELIEAFKELHFKISKHQLEIVNLHWGLDQIKNKKELLKIIDLTENIYKKNERLL